MKLFALLFVLLVSLAANSQVLRPGGGGGSSDEGGERGTNYSGGKNPSRSRTNEGPTQTPENGGRGTNYSGGRATNCPSGRLCNETPVSAQDLSGGIHCKECPAESQNCLPRADCCPDIGAEFCDGIRVGSSCSVDSTYGSCRLAPRDRGYGCYCSPDRL